MGGPPVAMKQQEGSMKRSSELSACLLMKQRYHRSVCIALAPK